MSIRTLRTHFKGPVAEGGNLIPMTVDPTLTPTAKTGVSGTTALVASDLNTIITNTGTTNVLALTLPAAVSSDNAALKIQATVASQINVVPASGEKIFLGGSGTADGVLVIPNTVGNYADLYCDGAKWMVVGYSGALSKST